MSARSKDDPQQTIDWSAIAVETPPVEDEREETQEPETVKGGEQPRRRATAYTMAQRQREISVSEFFSKNRHLLGFDNPIKALLTTIKEAVDNSLDACEEAGILPEVVVEVVSADGASNRFRVSVTDNGPGIVKAQIPKIFGKLLYGSKFHSLKQSRGQQGIGISAAAMYGQMTTGKPVVITSRPNPKRPAHLYHIQTNTRTNSPDVIKDEDYEWEGVATGTKVEIEMEGRYQRGKHSVDAYLLQTALANPHASIHYLSPDGEKTVFERSAEELPAEPLEMKPHPYGIELGTLIRMLKETKARNLGAFLRTEFSRVSAKIASEILKKAKMDEKIRPSKIESALVEDLYRAVNETKIMAPPTNCIVPIGEDLILKSLAQNTSADFVVARTRRPSVYRGNPFMIEAGLAYGGNMEADGLVTLYRYANRVPLLYQQSACAINQAVVSTDWRNYSLQQSRGALPAGPVLILVHVVSAWVPFTSESKEAIADYPEINKEIRLALQECGRKLSIYLSRVKKEAQSEKKGAYIRKYIPHIGIAVQEILHLKDAEREQVVSDLTTILERSRKA
jgi:DNA topoisomerase-6 subunit B